MKLASIISKREQAAHAACLWKKACSSLLENHTVRTVICDMHIYCTYLMHDFSDIYPVYIYTLYAYAQTFNC